MPPESSPRRTSPLTYRTIDLDAIRPVADVHRQAFPDSAVTQLGPSVVRRYYRWQLTGPHPTPYSLGAWRDGELVGFVFGGLRYKAVAGFARGSLGTIALGALTHPRAIRSLALPKVTSLARLMVYRRGPAYAPTPVPACPSPPDDAAHSVGQPDTECTGPSFGILSIAVLPSAQGSGVANELMGRAKDAAIEHGFSQMNLTVQVDNARAIAFYERWGWERSLNAGDWTGAMLLRLEGS